MYILNQLYKKKKPLYCDICDVQKKSVMGLLSHKSQCRKDNQELSNLMVTCELCGNKMLPVSMTRHMQLSHSNGQKVTSKTEGMSMEIVDGKRKAAERYMFVLFIIWLFINYFYRANSLICDVAKTENFDENKSRRIMKVSKSIFQILVVRYLYFCGFGYLY